MRLLLRRFPALGGLQLFALFCAALASVDAATITVTTAGDSGPGSLRQALADATDGDTIQFDPALNGQTIALTSGELVIDKNITISGPGPQMLDVSGPFQGFRVFHVLPNHIVMIEGLTISGGFPDTGFGGGIYNDDATLTIVDSTVSNNSTNSTGAGIYNSRMLTIVNSTVSGNSALFSHGGGIANFGTMTFTNSTVSDNQTNSAGGGISNFGMLTISNSTVSGNSARFSHGGPPTDGGGIVNGGTLEIINSTISGNSAGFFGGGVSNESGATLTITNSTVSGNSIGTDLMGASAAGGGIDNNAMLTITNSTVSGNQAIGKASGVAGGISNESGATLTITNSTVSGNFARYDGGGIVNNGMVEIANSTLSGNLADRHGAGIYNDGATLTITNSTVSGNKSAGGIYKVNGGTLRIGSTILNNSGANIFSDSGTVTSLGYNLSSDDGGGFLMATGDQINTDPMLGPLQNNGGPTFTHELLTGSPAIDAGDPNFTPPPFTDQRGYARVFNGRIDIGSLEVQPAPTPSPTPTTTATATATATGTATPTPTATATATSTATATPTATGSATASATGTPTPTSTATPTPTPSPTGIPSPTPAQALNISTRLRVETGDRVMIGGFIITGNTPKNVALRGIGPSLINSGLSDVLADPTLELRSGSGALLFQNDNWQDDSTQASQLIALGLAPQNPNESGIVAVLQPGTYTTIVAGKNNGTGVGLVEIYDTNQAANSQLANISTRGFVQTGDNVMIGGFILGGSSGSTSVAARGIGPSLSQSGLSNVLADPTLELRDGNGAVLIYNDNWQDDPASAAQLTAHGLAPQNSLESGIFATLPPGAFTAILAGKNGGTGIGLVEIYNVH